MTASKEHCCGADMFFDDKVSKKQYDKYLKKGPSRVTRKMIDQLSVLDIKGKSLIDIGGGIGALQWWFLQNGGDKTIGVDASSSYLSKAREHAVANNWSEQSEFINGDFVELESVVEMSDLVTLDKVVCCYPNFQEILETSAEKSKYSISLSYPVDGLLSRAIVWVGALFMKVKSNAFRPYVHPVQNIRETIVGRGFDRVAHDLVFPWHVETYVREEQIAGESLLPGATL